MKEMQASRQTVREYLDSTYNHVGLRVIDEAVERYSELIDDAEAVADRASFVGKLIAYHEDWREIAQPELPAVARALVDEAEVGTDERGATVLVFDDGTIEVHPRGRGSTLVTHEPIDVPPLGPDFELSADEIRQLLRELSAHERDPR